MIGRAFLKNIKPRSQLNTLLRCKGSTYLQPPGSKSFTDVTLIPGIFIGPEITRNVMFYLGSVVEVVEAAHAPIKFQTIENFSFDDKEKRKRLQDNPNILIGNVGNPGQRYVENTPFYKYLDLYVNGKLKLSKWFMPLICPTLNLDMKTLMSWLLETILKESIQELSMKSTQVFLKASRLLQDKLPSE